MWHAIVFSAVFLTLKIYFYGKTLRSPPGINTDLVPSDREPEDHHNGATYVVFMEHRC